ncbi:hypothetical protein GGS23DRAFT_544013 [Durotheca rogersii]|uniref:uncharacterized protein n=1 Tax=Durotheca rogersii TaxID=419775 RepID=UPI002220212E|nr:uncharacterized protein GGS23DRAFT_544013 [Durotheca rogersii]KAI5868096.1 hypothetical protein GGS23DRAFT_544013 [Durotheca rogersii]
MRHPPRHIIHVRHAGGVVDRVPRYSPLATVGAHLSLIVYLTYTVAAALHTSYQSLGPAHDTRSRLARRKKLVPAFVALASAALCWATYTSVAAAALSYQTWASEHGHGHLERSTPGGDQASGPSSSDGPAFAHVARWLSDTPFYYDALEIVVEKARRFWWSQQIDLATVAFSVLLSVEGRRRGIPSTPAFLALAHLVNLSYAQNLFYLALTLTPSPLPTGVEHLPSKVGPPASSRLIQIRRKLLPPKPRNWHPHPLLTLGALALSFGSIFLLPYAADTRSFANVVLFARVSTFLPLVLPEIVPATWGAVQSHPHDAHGSLTTIFQIVSATSFVLHAKAAIVGLIYNIPDSYRHRHSALVAWDAEERAAWERGTTALGKVLGSISDHPVVKAVGGDVLLCTLSLGVWAAVRAADVKDIIKSTVPVYTLGRETKQVAEDEAPNASFKAGSESAEDAASEHSVTPRRRGRRLTKSQIGSAASSRRPSRVPSEVSGTPGRKRGRPRKSLQFEEELAYERLSSQLRGLAEGDTLPAKELDWESAALAWGLAAFAGLGSASAGVFGAECVAR